MREKERTAFGQRVFDARREAKMTQKQLADAVGIAQSTLAEAESTASGSKHAVKLAQVMGVSPEWLSSGLGPKRPLRLVSNVPAEPQPEFAGVMSGTRRVPIVGTAKLGDNGYYEELSTMPGAGDGSIEHPSRDANAYGLRVRGNSMYPAIRDGWYVIVEPNGPPVVGEYVLVKLLNGQKMVKELLIQRQDSIDIESVNGGERRTIYNDELESVQPVAAVLGPSKWKPD